MHKVADDAQSWQQLNRLLDAALDQPPAQREQWLESLPGELGAFKAPLRELLSHAARVQTGDFLHTLPKLDLDPADLKCVTARGDQPGDAIGPYRLVRELGSGGMGSVWLAERIDGLIHRPVALKLPHGAWKRAGLAERMAREREILATLAHPGIAHLYDAGIAADGQPYLAIEYVQGTRIDAHCRDRHLDVRERLRLFVQVAEAVAYAHGKLVVHRDLKPANILVTADGQVRLLDFGIAKLMEEGQAKETRLTELSGRALTPDYASPEQIVGAPITIASDIYSLGVILYELLCEQRPYRLQRDSRGALEDAILQAEAAAPSDVADVPWRRTLRGDLDTIVLKTLKKVPAERYPTVHALLDDIERYLNGRPVLAQPDSTWYRLRKFVARNRLAVGAATVVMLVVLVGASIATWQARVALAQKARAEEVQDFIASVFREADPTLGKGKVLSAVELLRQAELRLSDRTDATPQLRLALLAIIGESLFGLQQNEDSARVLEQAVALQAATGTSDDVLDARLRLGLSQAYEYLGRNDDAMAELERSLAQLSTPPHDSSALFVRAKLHEAAMGHALADYEMAERAAREAISAATAVIGPRSAETATGLQLLSQTYTFTENREGAVDSARRAYEIMLSLHHDDAGHPKVMDSAMYYGRALQFGGDFDGAYTHIRSAVDGAARTFGGDSRMLGELLSASVPLQIERGDLPLAVADARRSIEIYLAEQEPGTPDHAARVRQLGHALIMSRQSAAAADTLSEALRLALAAKSTAGAMHSRAHLGLALAQLGRFEPATPVLREAIDNSGTRLMRAAHIAARNLGTSLRLQARPADALPWLEKATAGASVHHNHRVDLAYCLLETGLANLDLGATDVAQGSLERAAALLDEVQKDRATPARADLLVGLARVHLAGGRAAQALPLLQQADGIWHELDAQNRWAGETALWLGRAHRAVGRESEAATALARAQALLARSPLPLDVPLARLTRQH
jgi:eukaryotic-like serine/threonine-protein kinase